MDAALITQLKILRMNESRPNFSELARMYDVDRRTIKKYYDGYSGKPAHHDKASKLDKYEALINNKLAIKGTTMKAVYEFIFSEVDPDIGSYSNFIKYIKRKNLSVGKTPKGHPRFETAPGIQAQVDWKEDVSIANRFGEIFTFQVFDYKLGHSRYCHFTYKLYKTRQDVFDCLIASFNATGGVPKEILFDNMASIVDLKGRQRHINEKMRTFAKDFNFKIKLCKPRHAFTKGKVEVINKFISWVLPYEGEFETEEELIVILQKINQKVNTYVCQETGVPPLLLFQKEKEYLQPLPNPKVIESYLNHDRQTTVRKDSMISYMNNKYSVPLEYIGKPVNLRVKFHTLEIYFGTDLIARHELSDKKLNYQKDHYSQLLSHRIKDNDSIAEMAQTNLQLMDHYIDLVNKGEKSFSQALGELIEIEQHNNSLRAENACVMTAAFPFIKTMDEFDFTFQPGINKKQLIELNSLGFVDKKENILFVGSSGVGKTHLATSIGITCARSRISTYFIPFEALITQLKKALLENRLESRLKHFAKYKVLIIDEIGYMPIDSDSANLFFQLIAKRYERNCTIITTNTPFSRWGEIFGSPTLANAILDRLLHHSQIVSIKGPSYRLREKRAFLETQPEE